MTSTHHLVAGGADLFLANEHGISPLMACVKGGHVMLVLYLLPRIGEQELRQQTDKGYTVFHIAAGMC